MNIKIAFIGGIHGVGKSTICRQICSELNLEYLSASELIKWADLNEDAKNTKSKRHSRHSKSLNIRLDQHRSKTEKIFIGRALLLVKQ
jgi:broad-specificity NMP kinase